MDRDSVGGTITDLTTPKTDPAAEARLERLQRYVRVLDDGLRVPGTRFRIGLDPILGLIPGAGDMVGAVLSAAIIREGARRGVSRLTLLRMALYVAVDVGFGSVPLVGDLFDAVFKVNRFNLTLLERSLGHRVSKPSNDLSVAAILVALIAVSLVVAGGVTYVVLRLTGIFGA